MGSQGRTPRLVAWVATVLIALVFITSAIAKLMAAQPVVALFVKWGLRSHLLLIGVGELSSAVLFVIPRTHSLGLVLLTAYLGGAIATHMQNSEPYVFPATLLLAIWVTGYLRNPALFESFKE
jgi:uncharacterized membrane protein YphA (DoxX/SURF4 family)